MTADLTTTRNGSTVITERLSAMAETDDVDVEPQCDFCTTTYPTWSYPAKDFSLGGEHNTGEVEELAISIGGWAACDGCHELIEANDYDGLAQRSYTLYVEKHGLVVPVLTAVTLEAFKVIHRGFKVNRVGEAERVIHPV
jgi:hypothetical protein